MPVWISTLLNWAGLAAFISSLGALYIALKRMPTQDNIDNTNVLKNRADTIDILQGLVDQKAREIDEKSKSYIGRIQSLEADLAEVKSLSQAPFRATLEGYIYPRAKITKADIEVIPVQKTVTINEVK